MTSSPYKQVKRAIASIGIARVARQSFPNGVQKGGFIHLAGVEGGRGNSLKIHEEKGWYIDHATGEKGGDLVALWAAHKNIRSITKAAIDLANHLGISIESANREPSNGDKDQAITPVPENAPPHGLKVGMPHPGKRDFKLSAIWTYRTAEREVMFHVCRFESDAPSDSGKRSKLYMPCSYFGEVEGWHRKGPGLKQLPLFNLPEIVAHPDKPVLIVEGEKAADAAAELFPDIVVTTWPNGAGSVKKVDAKILEGRNVVIWPDNDEPGSTAAEDWKLILSRCGADSVRIVDPSPISIESWDLADEAPEGVDLHEMLEQAHVVDIETLVVFNRLDIEGLVGRLIYVGTLQIFFDPVTTMKFALQDINNLFRHLGGALPVKQLLEHPSLQKVEKVVYRPKGPRPIVNLEGGIRALNSYMPTKVVAMDGNPFPFIWMVQRLCSTKEEARLLIHWFAHLIQRPDHKIKFAIVIVGRQGTGKSLLARLIGRLVGETNFGTVTTTQLKGDFNPFMDSRVLNIFEEALDFGILGMGNKLKDLITEPTVTINEKYLPSYVIENYAHFIFLTNHSNALKIASDDRRYFVVNCQRKPSPPDYFRNMVSWLDKNEGVVLQYLQSVNLDDFNPDAPPPMTAGKELMMELSRDPLEQLISELVDAREAPFEKDILVRDDVVSVLKEREQSSYELKVSIRRVTTVFNQLGFLKLNQKGIVLNGKEIRRSLWACRKPEQYSRMSDRQLMEIYLGLDGDGQEDIPF